jgi:hypothetical protein
VPAAPSGAGSGASAATAPASTTPTQSSPPAAPAATAAPVDPAVAEEARRQSVLALRQQVSEQARLHALFWPLNRAAAPLCTGSAIATLGPLPRTLLTMTEGTRNVACQVLDVDERLTFTEVVADTAGCAGGDPARGSTEVDRRRPGGRRCRGIARLPAGAARSGGQAAAAGAAPAARGTRDDRGGASRGDVFQRHRADRGDSVNAHASGRAVLVSRGMLRFANDRELGVVIAHELAHIALGHTQPGATTVTVTSGGSVSGNVLTGTVRRARGHRRRRDRPGPAPTAPAVGRRTLRELDADTVGVRLAAAQQACRCRRRPTSGVASRSTIPPPSRTATCERIRRRRSVSSNWSARCASSNADRPRTPWPRPFAMVA